MGECPPPPLHFCKASVQGRVCERSLKKSMRGMLGRGKVETGFQSIASGTIFTGCVIFQ